MKAFALSYEDLAPKALVAIFQLADLLSIPPKRAAEIYLTERAKPRPSSQEAAA